MVNYVAFVSYGNDSIALLQWLHEQGKRDVVALHSDTGWAAPWWAEWVERGEAFARSLGYETVRTESEGMVALAKRKKAWPMGGRKFQFCTTELKILPARRWLEANDPKQAAVLLTGVRRQESKERRSWPEHTPGEENERYPGWDSWAPLVRHTSEERDALLARAGWGPLPHRSQECYPCVNANKLDVSLLEEARLVEIEGFEASMGVGERSGKPKTFFRPHKHGGAVGIRKVWVYACSKPGRYDPQTAMMFGLGAGSGCDSGMCSG